MRPSQWTPKILAALAAHPDGLWLMALTQACEVHNPNEYTACAMMVRKLCKAGQLTQDVYGCYHLTPTETLSHRERAE
jgi:hypothetical protein